MLILLFIMSFNMLQMIRSLNYKLSPNLGRPAISDVLAALSVAGVLLPEAVAYAAIAGIAPIHALLAGLIGLVVYPFIGSSRFAIVSPTSSAAAIFAGALAGSHLELAFGLVFVTGLLFLAAALLRMGFIGSFISRPVMQGFAWALALMIMLKQLPHMLGISVQAGAFFQQVISLIDRLPKTHLLSAALGLGALILWLGLHQLRKTWTFIAPSFIVLLLGIALSGFFPLRQAGVELVGHIDLGHIALHFPQLNQTDWLRAIELAPALMMIIFAESWESVRTLAAPTGDKVGANRELAGLGLSNIVTALVQGLPVGAGFSASSANQNGGAATKWASFMAGAAILALIMFARPELGLLPIPVLAAVVFGILSHHLWPGELLHSLGHGRDSWIAIICVLSVLLLGVTFGMVVSVGLSIGLAIFQFSRPLLAELGRYGQTHDYLDKTRHAEVMTWPHILIMRPEEPLFFANAEQIFSDIQARAQAKHVQTIIISLEMTEDLDATTLNALRDFLIFAQKNQLTVYLARVRDVTRHALQHMQALPHQAKARLPYALFWSVDDAVQMAIFLVKNP